MQKVKCFEKDAAYRHELVKSIQDFLDGGCYRQLQLALACSRNNYLIAILIYEDSNDGEKSS